MFFFQLFSFFFFSQKGGRAIGFLWILVYLGGMLIVFLYLIFLMGGINFNERKEEEGNLFLIVILSLFIFTIFAKNFFTETFLIVNWGETSFEFQEFYRVILTTSCFPIFFILLMVITGRLFLYLGILRKKMSQSKISFLFLFIIIKYTKFPILRSKLEGEKEKMAP